VVSDDDSAVLARAALVADETGDRQ